MWSPPNTRTQREVGVLRPKAWSHTSPGAKPRVGPTRIIPGAEGAIHWLMNQAIGLQYNYFCCVTRGFAPGWYEARPLACEESLKGIPNRPGHLR